MSQKKRGDRDIVPLLNQNPLSMYIFKYFNLLLVLCIKNKNINMSNLFDIN